MDYDNKYLKYKNKYLKLREELISQGVDVDNLMKESLNQLGNNKVEQSGGFLFLVIAKIIKEVGNNQELKNSLIQSFKDILIENGVTEKELIELTEIRQLIPLVVNKGLNVMDIFNKIKTGIQNNKEKEEKNNKYSVGGNIFITNQELSELNLTETPNVNEQEGGDIIYTSERPGTPQTDGSTGPTIPSKLYDTDSNRLLPHIPTRLPSPITQPKTVSTNVKNYYNYFDPFYPSYTVPAYNTVIRTEPIYTVPVNTFPVTKRDTSFFYDDNYVRPRKTSKRKTLKRKTPKRKTSKRKTSKRKTSKRKNSKRTR